MANITDDYLNTIVGKVAFACNLKDWQYTRQTFDAIAQNYFGIIIPVVLTGSKNGHFVDIRLVLKLAPTDERYRVSGAVTLFFCREFFFYTTLLKKYQDMQHTFSLESKFVIPECYYAQDEYCKEVIAMRDMCGEGYKPYVDNMFLDLEHVKVSLESLAKLHALSFILKVTDDKLYEHASKVCEPLTEKTNKRFMEIMLDRLTKALNKFENTEYVPLLENLKQNCAKFFDKAVELSKGLCICHGDVWKENILFKYENNKPVSACIIDYQTCRISSPAFDTHFLIISSTNTQLRAKHYFELLNGYYETFEQTMANAGLQAQSIYSRQMLDYDLQVVAPACLITVNTALWLSNGLQEEGHVRSKKIFTNPEEKEMAVLRYKNIIKAIIDDFRGYGYLHLERLL